MKDNIKGILYIGLLIFIVVLLFNVFLNGKKIKSNKDFNNYLVNNFDYVNILKNNKSSNFKFNLQKFIQTESSNIVFIKPVTKEKTVDVVKVEEEKTFNPIVYIYNTHNKESYYHSKTEPYNIVPTVVTTSYMLKEVLNKYDIDSIVEERSTMQVLNKNNWNYASSYRVTKGFLKDSLKKNPSLKYFIDIHRDSVNKNISTVKIEDKSYAKVLFILGLENKNYKENLKMIEYLNDEINKNYPKLSRGIYKKQGKGVNGVYNQDFSPNCILIEFGGEENTMEEVYNSVEVLGRIISKYIGEDNE